LGSGPCRFDSGRPHQACEFVHRVFDREIYKALTTLHVFSSTLAATLRFRWIAAPASNQDVEDE
jgi:hypothetical protein